MKFNVKKKKVVIISVVIIALLLFVAIGTSAMIFNKDNSDVSYFYDKDVGLIKSKIVKNGFFNLFQQAVTFTPTTINQGEVVSFTDVFTTQQSTFICGYTITIKAPTSSNNIVFNNLYDTPLEPGIYSITDTFTPNEPGTWLATTIYNTQSSGTGGCMSQGLITEQQTQALTVNTITSCNKTAYCDTFSLDSSNTIVNGIANKRICYTVSSQCAFTNDRTEYQTICNDGYFISGTTGKQADGIKTCVIASTETNNSCTTDSNCVSGKICDATTKLCVNAECNTALLTGCPNGINITTQNCVNGRFQNTSNTCPGSAGGGGNTTSTSTTNVSKTCWKVQGNDGVQGCEFINDVGGTICKTNDYNSEISCKNSLVEVKNNNMYTIIFSVAIIIVTIIAVIGGVMFYKRRRK